MRKRIVLALIGLIGIGLLLFIFFPRPLLSLAFPSAPEIEEVALLRLEGSEQQETVLKGEALSAMLKDAESTYLFRNPIRVDYVNNGPDFVGCFLIARYGSAQEEIKTVYLFTRNILSVDGVQYRFFGDGFAETLLALIEQARGQ